MRLLPRVRRLVSPPVRGAGEPPAITIVIPAYNVAAYIRETLASIRSQSEGDFEVIVVDDGSTDATVSIVKDIARRDPRIRLIRGSHAGQGAARNLGVDAAVGRYLCFVDADDLLPPGALRALLARAGDADVVVGALRRFNSSRKWTAEWVGEAHTVPRSGITLEDFPPLLRNFYPVAKLYRRDFWTAQGLQFGTERHFEDQPLITQLLDRARSIEVLTDIVYDYRAREDRSSNSQRPEEFSNLNARVDAWDRSVAALRHEASPAVLRAWLLTVYATHLHWYLNNDAVADPDYWAVLHAAIGRLAEVAPADLLEATPVAKRVAVALLLADRHDDLLAFRAAGGYARGGLPARVTPQGLEHSIPLGAQAHAAVAAVCTLCTRAEDVALRQQATGGGWVEIDGELRFRFIGYAYVPDLAQRRPDAVALVLAGDRGDLARIETTPLDGLPIDPLDAGQGYCADVPASLFAAASEQWTIEVEARYDALSVRAPLHNVAGRGGLPEAGSETLTDGRSVRLVASPNRHVGARFAVARPTVTATAVSLTAKGSLRVEGTVADDAPQPAQLTATCGPESVAAPVAIDGQAFTAELRLPAAPRGHTDWHVQVASEGSGALSVAWPAGRRIQIVHAGDLIALATVKGSLKVEDHRSTGVCTASSIATGERSLRLLCTTSGGTRDLELPVTTPADGDGRSPVRYDGAGLHLGAAASGDGVPVLADPGVLPVLPLRIPRTHLVLERGRGRSLVVRRDGSMPR